MTPTKDKAVPATLIERAVSDYIGNALRTNALLDPPIDALRSAAAELLKLTKTRNLRSAERSVAEEFAFRLELRLAGNTTGHAGACVRHVRERLESTFRLLH